jgi:hypothetical protein
VEASSLKEPAGAAYREFKQRFNILRRLDPLLNTLFISAGNNSVPGLVANWI